MSDWAACEFKPGKDDKMSDWMNDYVIEYEVDGVRHTTIWAGYTRETAIEDFKVAYPKRRVIEGEKHD